jgi:hypothetical protein
MKIRLLDLHIYVSLLCAPYLVVYALSTVSFNHRWEWMSPTDETHVWEAPVAHPGEGSDFETASRLRDELGLIGYIAPWELRPAPDGLRFDLWRPGRSYVISWSAPAGAVTVSETSRGLWGVLRDTHGLWGLDESLWSRVWGLYTLISIVGLMFAVCTGTWLWWRRPRAGRSGWGPLLWGSGLALAFMLYIVW